MPTFKDFLRWYNNKNVPPTLETMQGNVNFYTKNDMLWRDCTLPNLANIFLHKSTIAKFYPFKESNKDFLEKLQKDMVGGPSLVFTRKAIVDGTFIRDMTNWCKSIVGSDASQLYPLSTCQAMRTGLYTTWELDSKNGTIKQRQNKTRSFENIILSYLQRVRP